MALKSIKPGVHKLVYRGETMHFSAPIGKMEALKQEYGVNPYLLLANIAADPIMGSKVLAFLQVEDEPADQDTIAAWLWHSQDEMMSQEWQEMFIKFISDLTGGNHAKALQSYREKKAEQEAMTTTETPSL